MKHLLWHLRARTLHLAILHLSFIKSLNWRIIVQRSASVTSRFYEVIRVLQINFHSFQHTHRTSKSGLFELPSRTYACVEPIPTYHAYDDPALHSLIA